jgi:glucose/mannose-6-phosphate isomerase
MDIMYDLLEKFPQQLEIALGLNKEIKLTASKKKFTQVFVSGLGGSGIGATIVKEYVADKMTIPFITNNDYSIPKSVNSDTLFIACSYSGNTEETLSALAQAKKQKATIICIASGGELKKIAAKNNFPFFEIPSGMPPRTCYGYSLVQQLIILEKIGLLKSTYKTEIIQAIALLKKEQKNIKKLAQTITKKIAHHKIALYTIAGMEGVAIRTKQQILENSKTLCWHNVLPEMTHNEILGWDNEEKNVAVIQFTSPDVHPQTGKRILFLKKIINQWCKNYTTIQAKGVGYWEQVFYLINVGDWISMYLSYELKKDAIDIANIEKLKNSLK